MHPSDNHDKSYLSIHFQLLITNIKDPLCPPRLFLNLYTTFSCEYAHLALAGHATYMNNSTGRTSRFFVFPSILVSVFSVFLFYFIFYYYFLKFSNSWMFLKQNFCNIAWQTSRDATYSVIMAWPESFDSKITAWL